MYVLAPNHVVQQFPYTLIELRLDNPSVSFPQDLSVEDLAPWHVYPVTPIDEPHYDYATQNCLMVNPVLRAGQWVQQWSVTPATPAEIAERSQRKSADVRDERNKRLADCDWTQLPDAPVDHAEWAIYRQALRDVSSQPGFPWDVQWPSQP